MTTQTGSSSDLVAEVTRYLFDTGVMSHSGHANLSVRLDDERFALTTTGMVRDLRSDQLATVNLDGEVFDGVLSSENAEIVAMHSVIYKARREVGAIIHTHSPSATAFALANKELPCRAEPLLGFGQAEPVPPRGVGSSGI
jgi:L-ribulose-5-phosphate 4-epimerase